jgi:hypothetical protein
MVFWAAAAWSTGGFFVRLIPLDLWALLGWRSLFGVAADRIFARWQHPGRAGVALRQRVAAGEAVSLPTPVSRLQAVAKP